MTHDDKAVETTTTGNHMPEVIYAGVADDGETFWVQAHLGPNPPVEYVRFKHEDIRRLVRVAELSLNSHYGENRVEMEILLSELRTRKVIS